MAAIALQKVSKRFPDGTWAVRELSLEVADGEFLVLLGPSGCGKSTALRLLAGLETPSAGAILIDGRRVDALPPQRRNLAMVFQNYALYPHMSVRDNLRFPLRMRKLPKAEQQARVAHTAALLGLSGLLARRPAELSGGQRQRVAMGRALVRDPVAFLMDEPLSNLDAKLRVRIRAEIAALQQRLGVTTLYVTHDQVEAMTLGQRVAVLRAGVLQQLGPPDDVYRRPANTFVAGFLGSPPMNLFHPVLARAEAGWVLRWGERRLPLPRLPPDLTAEGGLVLGLRPEAFVTGEAPARVSVEVATVESLGFEKIVYFPAPFAPYTPEEEAATGTEAVFATRLPGPATVRPGERLELGLRLDEAHWFDAGGQRLEC